MKRSAFLGLTNAAKNNSESAKAELAELIPRLREAVLTPSDHLLAVMALRSLSGAAWSGIGSAIQVLKEIVLTSSIDWQRVALRGLTDAAQNGVGAVFAELGEIFLVSSNSGWQEAALQGMVAAAQGGSQPAMNALVDVIPYLKETVLTSSDKDRKRIALESLLDIAQTGMESAKTALTETIPYLEATVLNSPDKELKWIAMDGLEGAMHQGIGAASRALQKIASTSTDNVWKKVSSEGLADATKSGVSVAAAGKRRSEMRDQEDQQIGNIQIGMSGLRFFLLEPEGRSQPTGPVRFGVYDEVFRKILEATQKAVLSNPQLKPVFIKLNKKFISVEKSTEGWNGTGFEIVLRELINNSVGNLYAEDEKREGGRIEVKTYVRGENFLIEVIDNGVGLPAGVEPEKLFERFWTTKSKTTGQPQRVGLGLYLSRKFVEQTLGGTLTAIDHKSHGQGRGATFRVTIPIAGKKGSNDARSEVRSKVGRLPDNGSLISANISLEEVVASLPPLVGKLLEELRKKDPAVVAHMERVMHISLITAAEMGLPLHLALAQGALLHDIGKLEIPNEILDNPDPLSEDEWDVMETHTQKGAELLGSIPGFEAVREIAFSHH
ncbi:MAG: ATP-binding protein, partial [Candidatus Omnitrophota bacterium]